MSTRPWIFQINTFEVNTRGSNVAMLSLSTDTDSKLAAENADADILAIFNDYHPVFLAYLAIYQNYQVVSGERQGNTLNVEELMNEGLPEQLRIWEPAVRSVYPEDSPQEVEIFPNKRNPFLHGTYETRIQAVGALAVKLQSDVAFATLAPQVLSYYNVLLSARDTQQQKEGLLGQLSDIREQQRVILAEALYGLVLGQLMKKYRSDTSQIARFFDLSLLRNTEQLTQIRQISNVVAAGGSNTEGELDEGAKVANITLLSGGPVEFGLSLDGITFVSTPITISIPDTVEFEFEEEVPAGTLILVKNLNSTEASAYQIEIFA